MMNKKHIALFMIAAVILVMGACTKKTTEESGITELKHFPIDSIDELINKTGGEIDKAVSTDGNGSLRIAAAPGRTVVPLFEIHDLNIDNARLVYQAKVRSEKVEGLVYLEMWCGFTGYGESFSRNLDTVMSGTNDWTTMMAPFYLKKGEKPQFVKLNLVVEGKGTAWIDDVRLFKAPLN